MSLPILPPRAAYLRLCNSARRNALSLSVLRSLKSQLIDFNTDQDGRTNLLPPFKPEILKELHSKSNPRLKYLLDTEEWEKRRDHLPKVLVLRSDGPVFSSGHDLKELMAMDRDGVKETFDICAQVMDLITRSPAPVVCAIQGILAAVRNQQGMNGVNLYIG
jgi:enoyl-CoA hydratase/carnithine racemase